MFNVVFTDEGRALIAEIASDIDYSLLISDVKYSEHDYTGQEASVTEATFTGDFASGTKSISVVDSTTMRIETYFNNQYINEQKDLYTIGIFAKCVKPNGMIYTEIDSGLLAVCTVSTPRIIPPYADAPFSVFSYNINLAVGSADNVTVVETQAGVQYKELTTPITINGTQETTVEGALSGLNDYGDAIADNLAANENVYGAKNQLDDDYVSTDNMDKSGHTFTSNTTDTRSYFDLYMDAWEGTTYIQGLVNEIIASTGHYEYSVSIPNNANRIRVLHNGSQRNIGVTFNTSVTGTCIISLDITGVDPTTVGGLSFENIMIRDARITDDTFAPFAKTNLQLTNDKAERNDLSTIHATGSTNTTGATITNGTFFYLNGIFCKAIADIAVNATFTLNTNYKEDTVGAEIKAVENKDTSSFSVSTESGVSLQKAICRNGFVYLQLYFAALANSTKIATITDANYLPEGGNAVGLIEPNLAAEKINYTYGSFSGSNVYVYVSGSPTSGGIITFVYPVTGY